MLVEGCSDSRSPIGDLQRQLISGHVLIPSDRNFAEENLPENDRFESVLPTGIAVCQTPADVQTCVRWCVQEGVQPVVRGGGHSYIGASTTTGLLIKTAPMNEVTVDTRAQSLTVGAGARNINVLSALRGGALMLPIGTCPSVGVAGLTLGGGLGDNSRWAGMTCDHLQSTQIVLANGDIVEASAADHPDLFWALRGAAGGNFGINTSLTFRLLEIPSPRITIFRVVFGGKDAMLSGWAAFDRVMLSSPNELSGFAVINSARPPGADSMPAPGYPAPYPVMVIEGSFQGDEQSTRDLLAPVTRLRPTDVIFGEMDYWNAQLNWLAVPAMPKHGLAECSRFTNAPIPPDRLDQLVEMVLTAPGRSEDANAEVRLVCWSGGQVNRPSPDAMAYVHRSSNHLLRPAVWWRGQPQSMQQDLIGWLADTFRFISTFAQPSSFQNWPYSEQEDWQQAYYGANFGRLRQVKRNYDPTDLFRYTQSIPL